MLLKELCEKMSPAWRVEEIAWAQLPYKRPRIAGCNARLGVHGWGGEVPIARIKIAGTYGFGWCTLTQDQAQKMVGVPVRAMFDEEGMLRPQYYGIDFAILDWLGNQFHQPVYKLVARDGVPQTGFTVPVYDTTIYFDELDIQDDEKAVEFLCKEVKEGLDRGHKNFKVKVGRPGMWMGIESGLKRDVEAILAIRETMGKEGKLMADANNGYNLNLTKEFLSRTASANLYWMEEAFHEDDQLYGRLRQWMKEQGIQTKIADGEGYASEAIEEWAQKGLIDVLQYDLRGYGFFRWMKLAAELEPFGVLAAPHNYGGFYGNFAQLHFAAAASNFAIAEWDVADAQGIDTSLYQVREGAIQVPDEDGFGLKLDQELFDAKVAEGGWKAKM